jgi:hypothetical protein
MSAAPPDLVDRLGLRIFWTAGNGKLRKTHTIGFSLPAFRSADGFEVCPGAGACAAVCYARQGRYRLAESRAVRERNLLIVRANLDRFVQMAIADLTAKRSRRTVRVHDSGDFFSQAYLDAWFQVARACPRKRFYCYTKSLHLDWSAMPPNWRRVQSAGGKLDHLIDRTQAHALIFPTHDQLRRQGYRDGNTSDQPAIAGTRAIGLVYHGVRKLTETETHYWKERSA